MKRKFIVLALVYLIFFPFQILESRAFFFKKSQKENTSEKNVIPEENNLIKGMAAYLELEGDNVEYDQESNIYITTGMSTAHIIDQNANLEADRIVFLGNEQKIEATGNVKIIRDGITTVGENFNFDVTSNKYLLTNPETVLTGAVVKSRDLTNIEENNLKYTDGSIEIDNPIKITQGFGVDSRPNTFYSNQIRKKLLQKPIWEDIPPGRKYTLMATKIIYDNTKTLNNFSIYKPRLNVGRFSIPMGPKFTTTISSDPNVMSLPIVTPVIGTQGALGGFALGPSFNFNLNDYYIFSLAPFGQIGKKDEGFGIGGKISLWGPTTMVDVAYGSLKDRYTGQLIQKFGKRTKFRVGYNRYFEGGFLGRTLTEHNVGLVDKRSINSKLLRKITESGIKLRSEANWTQGNRDILPSNFFDIQKQAAGIEGSMSMITQFEDNAFKLEEQISLVSKPVFKLGTEKFNTALRFRTRNALRIYSTGDFHGIFTGGPILDSTIGPATFEIGYDQGYVQGESPLFYDQYLEGMQSISLDGDVRLCEYLTVGGYGTYNIKEQELIQKQFRAKVGPKDFKLLFNFDALRQQTQFGINFLFGRPIDFERFVIINSQRRLGS